MNTGGLTGRNVHFFNLGSNQTTNVRSRSLEMLLSVQSASRAAKRYS